MGNKHYVVASQTASLDVDPQIGFTPLSPSELPVADGNLIVDELNKNATKAQRRLASKDAHNPVGTWIATNENPQFSPVGTANVDIRWNRHCEVGTRGMDFIPGLPKPLEYDFVAYKGIEADSHPYGACYHDLADKQSTGLIEYLLRWDVKEVIVGGLALDYCVKTTVLQLVKAGFKVIVNLASTKAIDFNGSKQASIDEMKTAGVIFVDSADDIVCVR